MKVNLIAALTALAAMGLGALNAQEQIEKRNDVTVVYPASATSRTPIAIDARGKAVPPVDEKEEIDVETPLGKIECIADAIDSIENAQKETASKIEAFVKNAKNYRASERVEEILDAIERNAEQLQDAIAAIGSGRIKDRIAGNSNSGSCLSRAAKILSIGSVMTALVIWLIMTVVMKIVAKAWGFFKDAAKILRENVEKQRQNKIDDSND